MSAYQTVVNVLNVAFLAFLGVAAVWLVLRWFRP